MIPVAYEVLQHVFRNIEDINQFTWAPLVSAQLQGRIGENLILLNNQTKDKSDDANGDDTPFFGTTTMAVIFASAIAFFLTISCFLVACRYRHVWDSVFFSKRRGCHPTVNLAYWNSKRRRYWAHLDNESFFRGTQDAEGLDDNANPRWMVTNHIMPQESLLDHYNRGSIVMMAQHHQNTQLADRHENTIITRQYHDNTVSDLTGDTGSIKSSLKMDSIPEGPTEASYDEELARATPVNTSSSSSESDAIERERYSHYDMEGSNPDDSEESIDATPYASSIANKYTKDPTQDLAAGDGCDIQSQGSHKTEDAPFPLPTFDSDAETPIRSNKMGDFLFPGSLTQDGLQRMSEEEKGEEVQEHDLANDDLLMPSGESSVDQLFEQGNTAIEDESKSNEMKKENIDSPDKNEQNQDLGMIGAEDELSTIIHSDTDDNDDTNPEDTMKAHPGGTHMLESKFHELFEDPEFSTSLDELNISDGVLDKGDAPSVLLDLSEQHRAGANLSLVQTFAIISDEECTDDDYGGDDEQEESESLDENGARLDPAPFVKFYSSEGTANRQPLQSRDVNTKEMQTPSEKTLLASRNDKENASLSKIVSLGTVTPSKSSELVKSDQFPPLLHESKLDGKIDRLISPDGCWYFSKKDYLDSRAEQDAEQGLTVNTEDILQSPFGVQFLAETPEKENTSCRMPSMKSVKTITHLQYSEDSSLDCKRGAINGVRRSAMSSSLQDLRLLGPVVTDSTSEDISVLGQKTMDKTLETSLDMKRKVDEGSDGDCENDDDSGMKLGLPLPYLVAGDNSRSRASSTILDSSILSDITNPQDTDSSYCSVPFKEPGSEMSI